MEQHERLKRYEALVDRIMEMGVDERTAIDIAIMIANHRHREEQQIERIVMTKDPEPTEVIKLPRRIP